MDHPPNKRTRLNIGSKTNSPKSTDADSRPPAPHSPIKYGGKRGERVGCHNCDRETFSRARIFVGRDVQAPPAARTLRSDSTPGQGCLASYLQEAFASNFDFMAVPLVRKGLKRDDVVVLTNGRSAPRPSQIRSSP